MIGRVGCGKGEGVVILEYKYKTYIIFQTKTLISFPNKLVKIKDQSVLKIPLPLPPHLKSRTQFQSSG